MVSHSDVTILGKDNFRFLGAEFLSRIVTKSSKDLDDGIAISRRSSSEESEIINKEQVGEGWTLWGHINEVLFFILDHGINGSG